MLDNVALIECVLCSFGRRPFCLNYYVFHLVTTYLYYNKKNFEIVKKQQGGKVQTIRTRYLLKQMSDRNAIRKGVYKFP